MLGPLLAVQWLALLALALSVKHNGWLYYQGGDETYYYTGAHLLSDWRLPTTPVGYGWTYLITPVALFSGPIALSGLAPVILFNTLVLLPVALLCVYGIAARIGGRVLGYWAAGLWIAVPYVAIPLFDQRYHQKYVEIALPQQLGLTILADFPSMVCLLLTAYLLVRALDTRDWRDAALAGLAGGFAIGIKPSTALFFAGAGLALLAARRWRQIAVFAGTLVPALVVLAIWKQRGLGELPAFAGYGGGSTRTLAAAGPVVPVGSLLTPFRKYVDLDWHQLHENLDEIREFFWAVRPLEWVPLAGLLAIGRRSWPKALLVFGWFAAYLVIKGTSEQASVEDASFFRLLMPSFPAFLLLLAAVPLLVPSFGLTRRLLVPPAVSARRFGNRLLGGSGVLLVLAPLVIVAATSPLKDASAVSEIDQGVYVPVRQSFRLSLTGGDVKHLSWNEPYSGRSRVFYAVLRSRTAFPDPSNPEGRTVRDGISCIEHSGRSSVDCRLFMTRIGVAHGRAFSDRPPPGRWTYRVALSANWIDDPNLGDMLVVSPPVNVVVPG
ncbi:MAG TPA: glycosyltransferase family 39 protein [Gaiellaceae bacterium]|nr:glycosyltransferase family 39 protein [Gaiellaceae bacterium]